MKPKNYRSFFRATDTVLALVSWDAPRLFMVSRNVRQRWQDAAAYYPAFRWRAKLFKLFLRGFVALQPSRFVAQPLRTGRKPVVSCFIARLLDRLFPDFSASATARSLFPFYFGVQETPEAREWQTDAAGAGDILSGTVEQCFPNVARCVVCLGSTAHAKQKLIVQARDQQGQICGYIKYGETKQASESIVQEHQVLAKLPAGVAATCLDFQQDDDRAWIALSALKGHGLPPRLPKRTSHQLFHELSMFARQWNPGQVESIFIDNHPAIKQLLIDCHRLDSEKTQAISRAMKLEQLADAIIDPLRKHPWPVVLQHGDFAPWNVIRCASTIDAQNRLAAIDWEEGAVEGFPFLDIVYYVLQTGFLMHHWPATQTVPYARHVLGEIWSGWLTFECTPELADSLVRLAALQAWIRSEELIPASALQACRAEIFLTE